jgi:hypothetical protein
MKQKNSRLNLTLFLIVVLISGAVCDSVCDLELFVMELKQDLEDNGILDCLRIIKPPSGVIETIEQKNKRLAAQWDTACSFESTFDWVTSLKKNYGVTTLVDEIGEPVDHNLPDQADMCEIIRAVIKEGLLAGITSDVTDIPFEALNYIDCPGNPNGPKICAVNAISYWKTDMWTIMLDGMNIQINNSPNFVKSSETPVKQEVPDDPGVPVDRTLIEAVTRLKAPSSEELQRLIASSKDFTKTDKKKPEDPFKRVTFKMGTFTKENISSNSGWNTFNSGKVELQSNIDFFILSYSMVSGKARNSRLAVRMLLNGVNQISTRMIQGYQSYPSLTTGFISGLQAGSHKIDTQYRSSESLSFDMDNSEKENITTGVLIIPTSTLLMKKVINPMEITLYNDNLWTDFPNLQTTIKLKKSAYVLVMYNLSLPGMQSHLLSRVDINTLSVFVYFNLLRKVDQLLGIQCIGEFTTRSCTNFTRMWNTMSK